MLRIAMGFLLGAVVTFYALPWIESVYGELPRSDMSQLMPTSESTYSSNVINSMSPQDMEAVNKISKVDFATQMMTAIAVTKSGKLDEQTSPFVIGLITSLIEEEPTLRLYVQNRLSNGLTNKEAMEIFEEYFLAQS